MPQNHIPVSLANLVARQLPEFIRSEYPTFVSFLEAYYEYVEKSGVNLEQIRDIDSTLDDFIQYFKQELAHNYPVSNSYDTERYLLKHVKDQYLAKGSEASYKLLFRLLYGKDVYMDYPGKQMLRVSDGKWQQDVSIFVKVNTGDAYSMIGKTVSIQTTKKISRDPVTAKAIQVDTVTATIENVIKLDGETDIFEFFLDRNFYGEIFPKDVIKYSTTFQGQVLSCTTDVSVGRGGEKFRPGMVFKVSSGEGTPLWFKVLKTDSNGGLVTVDLIKFGLFYNTDFAVTLLPTSAATTRKKFSRSPIIISYELVEGVINGVRILNGGQNYQVPPAVIIGGTGTGAQATAILDDGVINFVTVSAPGIGYLTTPNVYVGTIGSIEWEANMYVQAGTMISAGNGSRYYIVKDKGALGTTEPITTDGSEETNGTAVLYWVDAQDNGGSGAVIAARIGVDLEAGQVTDLIIEDGGTGYDPLNPPSIIIAGHEGEGAIAAASVANGVVRRIEVDPLHKGKGYGTAFINIVPIGNDPGTGASAEPLLGSDYSYLYNDETNGFTENGYLNSGDYWDITEHGKGATATAVLGTGASSDNVVSLTVTAGGSGYNISSPIIEIDPPFYSDGTRNLSGTQAKATATVTNGVITGYTITDQGSGYIAAPNVKVYGAGGYSDGAYVGTVIRQFFIDAKDTIAENPALVNVSLGAVAKYPGYFKTNDGFLDDSIYIQDSYYYQTFSYVIRIDEQLQSYASVVRTMLHPSGMALFGEYSINNSIALSIALDSLVKSLGVTLYDDFRMDDSTVVKSSDKFISDDPVPSEGILDGNRAYPFDTLMHIVFGKYLQDSVSTIDYSYQSTMETTVSSVTVNNGGSGYTYNVLKPNIPVTFSTPTGPGGITATGYATINDQGRVASITVVYPGYGYIGTPTVTVPGGTGGNYTVNKANMFRLKFTKSVIDTNATMTDQSSWLFTKAPPVSETTVSLTDTKDIATTKVFQGAQESVIMSDPLIPILTIGLNSIADNITDTGYVESGYLHLTPYDQGGYFASDYNVGRLRDFSS